MTKQKTCPYCGMQYCVYDAQCPHCLAVNWYVVDFWIGPDGIRHSRPEGEPSMPNITYRLGETKVEEWDGGKWVEVERVDVNPDGRFCVAMAVIILAALLCMFTMVVM